jgi:hypothetical protein
MLVKKKGRNVASYESKYPGGVGEGLVSLMQSKSQASSMRERYTPGSAGWTRWEHVLAERARVLDDFKKNL